MELVIDNSDFSKKGILESLHKYSEGIREDMYTKVCELVYTTMLNKVIDNCDNIELVSINVDEDTDIAVEHKVRHIPTLLLMKDNNEIDRLVGSHTIEKIKEFLFSRT